MPQPHLAALVFSSTNTIRIIVLGVIAVAVGFILLFAVMMFIVALWEKQLISPFTRREETSPPSPDNGAGPGSPPPYLWEMNRAIAEAGFGEHVPAGHAKGGTYRMFASGWLSPRRDILVLASGGTMARVTYRRTILQTWVGDRLYMTTDENGTPDQTGFVDTQVVKNADFPELLSTHLARLQPVWHLVRPHPPHADPLACYAAVNRARAEAMSRRGLIRYTSPEREGWRSTIKGAVLLTIASVHQMFTAGQPDRMKMPRPGDPAYRHRPAFPVENVAAVMPALAAPEIEHTNADLNENWYPTAFGRPDAAGEQGGVRFAFFAQLQRLVVLIGQQRTVYDTNGYVITGIAPRHVMDDGRIVVTTPYGPISLDQLAAIPM